MRKPGFTLQLSLFHSAILAGHLPSTPSSVFHLQNENKNSPKYLYNSDEKRSPQNTNQSYTLSMCSLPFCVCVCVCVCVFPINDVNFSPWLDPGLWSPSLSLLLSCSAVSMSRVNQVPILAKTVLYWAFLSVLFVVGRIWKGAGAFRRGFLPSPPNPCPSPAAEQVALLLPRECTGNRVQEPGESEGRFGSSSF